MFEQAFKNIDNVLRKEAGCTTELDYTEQSSWLLFLKYLDGLEQDRATEAELEGKKYAYILDKPYRWESWAAPKGKDGQIDHNKAKTGDDLCEFVDDVLFPYLRRFKQKASGPNTIEYKIGEIFVEIKNKISSGYNLREILDHIDELRFRSQTEKHELSHLYEAKIRNMGNAGRNGGEYYTPRPLIRAMVRVVKPKIGERILANQKPELSAKLKALIERVEKQRAVYLSLREDLDDADRPAFKPPDVSRQDSREAAAIARKWLGLADENSFDSYRAAVEARGVLVFRSNGYSGKWQIAKENPILGFTLYDPTCPVIVIKKLSWESRQSFTLAHELGHLLMHKSSSIDDEQDMQSHQGQERDANAFAGHLLVPDVFLTSIRDTGRPDEVSQYDAWLAGLRRAWGVSGEVILRRLLNAGRLPQSQYDAYRHWRMQSAVTPEEEGGSRAYLRRKPKHVFGDTFVRTVLDALNARHITLARASGYLDSLKIKDLHQLERHYAGI